ncbi:DUF7286 family protein [Halorussus caseinilyticus]|uniref:Uncharacterized protein n=1 Tax=Halorussus caseinilyticus TaxID=3034025 RepID=A0ABD5WTB4_9EURY|nr:hypothetical protein [Halorussus sp. DT72]
MNFAEDRRARVPFALVGVLLLVGSAGLSATLAGGPAPTTDESVGVAVDRATAATDTALRGAVARAGRRAAAAPVTDPANTTAGRVLNDSTPFRDSLRVRIYLAARSALGEVSVRSGSNPGPDAGSPKAPGPAASGPRSRSRRFGTPRTSGRPSAGSKSNPRARATEPKRARVSGSESRTSRSPRPEGAASSSASDSRPNWSWRPPRLRSTSESPGSSRA